MLTTLAERRWLPDPVIRTGIRRLLRSRLAQEHAAALADPADRAGRIRELFAMGPIAEATDDARRQHYEAPTELFAAMLGPRLKYSGCLWGKSAKTLAAAEETMLALTCQRAGIADGQRVLDLGCGWGSLALWMAEHYPGAEVVAASNSRTQHEYVTRQAAERELGNLRHVVLNVAELDDGSASVLVPSLISSQSREGNRSSQLRFDRIVSVEMFEHLRNVQRLLEHVGRWLTDDGRLFIHMFCHRELCYRFADDGPADWMARHFFTGGAMPPLDLFDHVSGPLQLLERWEVGGQHYARTCAAWLANLDRRAGTVRRRLEMELGAAEASQQLQRWRMFLMACEELFAHRGGDEWLVSHHLLAR